MRCYTLDFRSAYPRVIHVAVRSLTCKSYEIMYMKLLF